MQQRSQYKRKMQRYVTNIRRDARQKALKQMRKKIYFETQSIDKIAWLFKLPLKQDGEYTILEIMKLRFNQLISVTDKLGLMSEQIFSSEFEEINLDAHVQFWGFLLQQFFIQMIQINQDVQLFFCAFMKNNSYRALANFNLLQLKSLNTLQVAMISPKASKKIKNMALEWVQGTDGLILIQNCLANQFLHPNQYGNVYGVIKEALKIGNLEKLEESCTVIKQIMKNADFDQTFCIYEYESDLMVGLQSCIVNFIQDDTVESVQSYADAVVYLMDSYDQLVFDYGRMGVALLATRMIISKKDHNMVKGLQIIKLLSQVQLDESITFLLTDRQLNDAGLWRTILGSQVILMNRNIAMRRETYNMLANVMANGNQQHLEILEKKVSLPDKKSVLELIDYGLKNQEDVTILRYILIMLSVLVYYSRNYEQEGEHDENRVLRKIMQYQLELVIKKLTTHENGELGRNAEELLKNIEYLRNTEQH